MILTTSSFFFLFFFHVILCMWRLIDSLLNLILIIVDFVIYIWFFGKWLRSKVVVCRLYHYLPRILVATAFFSVFYIFIFSFFLLITMDLINIFNLFTRPFFFFFDLFIYLLYLFVTCLHFFISV